MKHTKKAPKVVKKSEKESIKPKEACSDPKCKCGSSHHMPSCPYSHKDLWM